MADLLFDWIEDRLPSETERFLDAGTGSHSLEWVLRLKVGSVTAVTADEARRKRLAKQFADRTGEDDLRLLVGNWVDEDFLSDETFDVVLADYLIGAVEGFAPYEQETVLRHLRDRTAVGGNFFLVGWEPFEEPATKGQEIIHALWELKCAAWRLAGVPPYREYPESHMKQALERLDFTISDRVSYTNVFRNRYVRGQARSVRQAAERLEARETVRADGDLATSIRASLDQILAAAKGCDEFEAGVRYGRDYVLHARRKKRG